MILQAIFLELRNSGFCPDWYDEDKGAFTVTAVHEFHIWIKGYWLYYWWEGFGDQTYTRRIDLNDPDFMELLTNALAGFDNARTKTRQDPQPEVQNEQPSR